MSEKLTVDNVIDQLVQKSRKVAHETTTDQERFEALWDFANDVNAWLCHLPPDPQEKLLQTMRQLLETRVAPGVTDPEEVICFAQLLALVYDPPPYL